MLLLTHLVIIIFGLSLLLLRELVSSCFRVAPMLVLVGVRLALLDETPAARSVSLAPPHHLRR